MPITHIASVAVQQIEHKAGSYQGAAADDGKRSKEVQERIHLKVKLQGKSCAPFLGDLIPGLAFQMKDAANIERGITGGTRGPMPDLQHVQFAEPDDSGRVVWEMKRAKVSKISYSLDAAGDGLASFSLTGKMTAAHAKAAHDRNGGCDGLLSGQWVRGSSQPTDPRQETLVDGEGKAKPPRRNKPAPTTIEGETGQ